LKVEVQAMDWQTLVSRRTKKEPADKGGGNALFTSSGASDMLNPVSANLFNASCEKATCG
jgi:peptide/nickel transport system substrate-binding protein